MNVERFAIGDLIGDEVHAQHYVYELIDAAGAVFYVGVTSDPRSRFKAHAKRGSEDIKRRMSGGRCRLRIVSIHDCRATAEDVEARRIRKTSGLLNQVHQRWFGRSAGQ